MIKFFLALSLFSSLAIAAPEPKAVEEEKKETFSLTAYEPIYFLYNGNLSKVQASFKYQAAPKIPVFIGYTHQIFWLLRQESKPFYDVNYNPEIFYRLSVGDTRTDSLDFIAWGHKSNGKDKEESRSYDYAAVQYNPGFTSNKNWLLRPSVRLRLMYNLDETNKDLREYLGPVELKFKVVEFTRGFIDKGEINLRLFTGGKFGEKFNRGGQELGFGFRIRGLNIAPSFMIQYYQGYAESLRDYNVRQNILRFGISL